MSEPIAPKRQSRWAWLALSATVAAVAGLGLTVLLQSGDGQAPFVEMIRVQVPAGKEIAVGRTEITVRQWNRCHDDGGCAFAVRAPEDGQDYPATGISYLDAQDFLTWINRKNGPTYRLPTKAEWYALASEVLPAAPDPIFTAPELRWASAYLVETPRFDRALHPTGAFSVTRSGIEDLDGNVWEWTQDCYDGQTGLSDPTSCPAYVMGGLHESIMPFLVRDPANGGCASGLPPAHLGFRLVSDRM